MGLDDVRAVYPYVREPFRVDVERFNKTGHRKDLAEATSCEETIKSCFQYIRNLWNFGPMS